MDEQYLLSKGWSIASQIQAYRWRDPRTRNLWTLEIALKIQRDRDAKAEGKTGRGYYPYRYPYRNAVLQHGSRSIIES